MWQYNQQTSIHLLTLQHAPQPLYCCCCTVEALDPGLTPALPTSVCCLILIGYLLTKVSFVEECYTSTSFERCNERPLLSVPQCVCMFVCAPNIADRASTTPSNIRGCQSDMWSAGHEQIRGTSTELQREHKKQKVRQTRLRRKEQQKTNASNDR